MITGRQIRAARGLLDMSRDELAKAAGLTKQGISKIEDGSVQPRAGTLADIVRVFNEQGVEFKGDRGVELRDDVVRVLEGDNAYLQMMEDVFYATKDRGGEVLWMYSSDRYSLPGEEDAEIRLRKAGLRFRSLVEEGNLNPVWDYEEYRQIPKQYFNHSLQVIYADKVAQVLEGGRRILIIHNETFTTTARHNFNLIWSLMKSLPKKDSKDGK
jgi:DNA-binding XRE family transcriptional regulator